MSRTRTQERIANGRRRFESRWWLAAILGSALTGASSINAGPNCPPRYTATWVPGQNCGIIGHGYAWALGGNDSGVMCGLFACPGGSNQAFISYDGQTLTPLPLPPGNIAGKAVQVNDAGSVIGEYGTLSEGGGFIKTKDAFVPITWPGMIQMGGDIAYAHGLNSNDIVVGAWGNTVVGPFPMSYRWEKGVLQNLDADMPLKGGNWANAISNNGLITGYMGQSASSPNHHAYIWNDGQVTDLGVPFANCVATEGRSINSKGHVCGVWRKTTDSQQGFVRRSFFYDGKQMIDLGQFLGWPDLIMQDLNEANQVVGYGGAGGTPGWAVLWQNGHFYRLDDLIEQGDVPVEMQSGQEITNNGTIFGYGKVPGFGSSEAIRLTPIPPRTGDVDCDADVDVDDLLGVINQWGRCEPSCDADLNIDGVVGSEDLMTVISDWDE